MHDLAPRNRALLKKRDELQARIDGWHRAQHGKHSGKPFRRAAYKAFLAEIGYLVPEGPDFAIDTAGVDAEIAHIAGPQLVVPVTNARYSLNAANARWGSLYDALYGTDALPEDDAGRRAPAATTRCRAGPRGVRLDQALPRRGGALAKGSHAEVRGYAVQDGRLVVSQSSVADTWVGGALRKAGPGGTGQLIGLADPSQLIGYRGDRRSRAPSSCATTACTSRSRSTAGTTSASPTMPASPTCWSRRQSPPWST